MTTIPVSQWLKKMTSVLQVTDPVWKAWRAMKDHQVKVLPVQSNDKIIGIVSAKDIVRVSDHNGGQSMSVKEAMSLDPLVMTTKDSIVDVVVRMMERGQQHVVITDGQGSVEGVFSWSEAFEFFLKINNIDYQNKLKEV